MKRIYRNSCLLVGCMAIMGAYGCSRSKATYEEARQVEDQQAIYNKIQPIPTYDFSLTRQIWIDFYNAQNKIVSTWSADCGIDGVPVFITPSMGFPTPRDTQLTNPLKSLYGSDSSIVEQAEPNGTFTSKNTTATVVMCTNKDGTVSPYYTEGHVRCWTFPVRWDAATHMFVRVDGSEPTIKLKPREGKTATRDSSP